MLQEIFMFQLTFHLILFKDPLSNLQDSDSAILVVYINSNWCTIIVSVFFSDSLFSI